MRNVVAKVEGSDANRSDEAVLYTAHYDHFGIDPDARRAIRFITAPWTTRPAAASCSNSRASGPWRNPRRRARFCSPQSPRKSRACSAPNISASILPVPASKITLDLNYDALAPIGDPEEVEVSGAERTTFYPEVEKIAKSTWPRHQARRASRSGPLLPLRSLQPRARRLPAFSISEGLKFKGHDLAWGEAQSKDYVEHHYHQPADEFVRLGFHRLAQMTQFGVRSAKAAPAPNRQGWQPGDEFEAARKKSN